jgi:hypothetical protein
MAKDNQSKQASKCSGNKASQTNKFQPKIVLQFKDPKPSDNQIKSKFYKVDESEVTEQIRCFKTGDIHANLVNVTSRIFELGNSYELWENVDSRKLAQSLNRALSGQVKDNWKEILGDDNNWRDVDKDRFVQMLQKLGAKRFGPMLINSNAKR